MKYLTFIFTSPLTFRPAIFSVLKVQNICGRHSKFFLFPPPKYMCFSFDLRTYINGSFNVYHVRGLWADWVQSGQKHIFWPFSSAKHRNFTIMWTHFKIYCSHLSKSPFTCQVRKSNSWSEHPYIDRDASVKMWNAVTCSGVIKYPLVQANLMAEKTLTRITCSDLK